jgi:hypothetical protein
LNLVISCVSRTPIQQTSEGARNVGRMSFPNDAAAALAGQHNRSLKVFHAFDIVEGPNGWRVHSRAYAYYVLAGAGREIIAFHWHPGRGSVALPHAHFRTLNDPFPMGKAHMPTGRISLEALVRLLIDELAVEPLRRDWRRVLTQTERNFIERRRWHGYPPSPGGPLESRQST